MGDQAAVAGAEEKFKMITRNLQVFYCLLKYVAVKGFKQLISWFSPPLWLHKRNHLLHPLKKKNERKKHLSHLHLTKLFKHKIYKCCMTEKKC